jgi:N6-L-threonylcarbamoyladenine synthase
MNHYQIILGIETSCDETAAAILKKTGDEMVVLSSVIASSAEIQAKFGGIIPEQAAREQVKAMIPVLKEALNQAFPSESLKQQVNQIDTIAVTYGPGLIGSLLVGVETAKTLALTWNKPLLAINHLIGHYYANWIQSSAISSQQSANTAPQFPCIGLLVSGGHTDLVLFKSHHNYLYIGGTRDDAAGECFDKCARLLGYSYPGGPKISQLAKEGDPKKFQLPLPMNNSHDFDFSFSGLKTAFLNIVKEKNIENGTQEAKDLCATLENTIVKSLVKKTIKAAQDNNVSTIIVGGGVSANQKLREELRFKIQDLGIKISLHFPELKYCGDNAAMVAAAAFFTNPIEDAINIQANPNLSL